MAVNPANAMQETITYLRFSHNRKRRLNVPPRQRTTKTATTARRLRRQASAATQPKPTVNTSGQTVGAIINVKA